MLSDLLWTGLLISYFELLRKPEETKGVWSDLVKTLMKRSSQWSAVLAFWLSCPLLFVKAFFIFVVL